MADDGEGDNPENQNVVANEEEVPEETTDSNPDEEKKAEESSEDSPLVAANIYVLMNKQFRLSRNARAQWYLRHLRGELRVKKYEDLNNFRSTVEAVAVEPEDPPADWDWDVGHLYRYIVTQRSMVHFLAQTYRFVYILDLSPSATNSDLLMRGTLNEGAVPALRQSLDNLVRPFYVPGSQLLLKPDIYVTVIAWTPFIGIGAQAVLHQGCLVTPENVNTFMDVVVDRLNYLERSVFQILDDTNQDMEELRADAERLTYGLFEDYSSTTSSLSLPSNVVTADTGFVSMVRTGVLALQLMPSNSSAKIVVISDGMTSPPDIRALDDLLSQLRKDTIALSFIQTSSVFHPNTSLTRIPYQELMEYMALSTYGAFLAKVPEVDTQDFVYIMNIYHKAFLCWGFRKALQGIDVEEGNLLSNTLNLSELSLDLMSRAQRGRFNGVDNSSFAEESVHRFTRRRFVEDVQSSLPSLLSIRLREGYTVNSVLVDEDKAKMEVRLTLPWKINSFVHYSIQADWPLQDGDGLHGEKPACKTIVHLEGGYDTMHDLMNIRNSEQQAQVSRERSSVTNKFQLTLQHLNYVDKLLVHLESFTSNPANYTLPDSVADKVPVFHLPQNSASSNLGNFAHDSAHGQFFSYWKPINSLDLNIWHRWLHTHRINLLMNNDYPMQKHFLLPNASGRYANVHCRKATVQLTTALNMWCTFILCDNSTYVKFKYDDDEAEQKKQPSSFYIVRLTAQPPCVVLYVAFHGGTPGSIRKSVVGELKTLINQLRIKQVQSWRDPSHNHQCKGPSSKGSPGQMDAPLSENVACTVFKKPLERILVRYDKQPNDFSNFLEPAVDSLTNNDETNGGLTTMAKSIISTFGFVIHHRPSSGTFLTVSRYLKHYRWVWNVQNSLANASVSQTISDTSVARILSTLSRIRQIDGFSFAHSNRGIQTMAVELPIKNEAMIKDAEDGPTSDLSCVVQYVLFPPHSTNPDYVAPWAADEDSFSQAGGPISESCDDNSNAFQIITELWIEPQDGQIKNDGHEWTNARGKTFADLPGLVFPRDKEVISSLLTCENLRFLCLDKAAILPHQVEDKDVPDLQKVDVPQQQPPLSKMQASEKEGGLPSNSIIHLPMQWNLTMVLKKSQQVELLFSMLIQDLSEDLFSLVDPNDSCNEILFEHIRDRVAKLHDREIALSDADHSEFMEFLTSTQDERSLKFPKKDLRKQAKQSRRPSSMLSSERGGKSRISSRMTSGHSSTMTGAGLGDSRGHRRQTIESLTCAKWICYAKATTHSRTIVTIMPRSYRDLKQMLIDEHTLNGNNPMAVSIVQKPIQPLPPQIPPSLNITTTDSMSINSSMSNLDSDVSSSEPRPKSGSISRVSKTLVSKRGSIPDHVRNRTMSIDSSQASMAERLRCRSMDNSSEAANGNQTTLANTSSNTKTSGMGSGGGGGAGPARPRTQTSSQIQTRTSKSKLLSAQGAYTTSTPLATPGSAGSAASQNKKSIGQPRKKIWGSVTLPVFSFDVRMSSVVRHLLHQNNPDFKKPKCASVTGVLFKHHETEQRESESDSDPKSPNKQQQQKDVEENDEDIRLHGNPLAEVEKAMRIHAINIQMVYYRSFVAVLYKGLHRNLPLHSYDIQSAIVNCDEDVTNLDITDFIVKICNHVIQDCQNQDQPNGEATEEGEAVASSSCKTRLSIEDIAKAKGCSEIFSNHTMINKKFNDILLDTFCLVPHSDDLYYYAPGGNANKIGDEIFPPPSSRLRRDTRDLVADSNGDLTEDFIMIGAGVPGAPVVDEDEASKLQKASSMSLLSNAVTSEDPSDLNESREQDFELHPLFLQVLVTIKQDGREVASAPISQMPTCFIDLVKIIVARSGFETSSSDFKSLDLAGFSASLDLRCIMQPPDVHSSSSSSAPRVQNSVLPANAHVDRFRSVSLCSNMTMSDQQESMSSNGSLNEIDDINSMPTEQEQAFAKVVADLTWMLEDEIAFALTVHSGKITESTLEHVSKHLTSSDKKPGCSVTKIPLQFVFGQEKSLAIFLEGFDSKLDIEGWRRIREGKHSYFVKIQDDINASVENEPEPAGGDNGAANDEAVDDNQDEDDDEIDISNENDLTITNASTRAYRFQLSPVKEARTSMSASQDGGSPAGEGGGGDLSFNNGNGVQQEQVCEDDDSVSNNYSLVWCEDPHEARKRQADRPQYWLILNIADNAVNLFFQFREGQPEAMLPWKQFQLLLAREVKELCHRVNQTLLLADLFLTRDCNRLLEAEDDADLSWYGDQKQKSILMAKEERREGGGQQQEPREGTLLEANLKLPPGKFTCPCVWEKEFYLHPRMRETTPQGLRGLLAVKMVLNCFSVVNNRTNMYVYKDKNDNIFYFKIRSEKSTQSSAQNDDQASDEVFDGISRTSSISSTNRSTAFERVTSAASGSVIGGSSVAGAHDKIVFRVYGVNAPADDITTNVVGMISRKIDEKLVDILSTILQRNPMSKLTQEDVHFLQKPKSLPNQIVRFKLNPMAASHLEAFQYYLRQNLVNHTMIVPKFASKRSAHRFQDSVDGQEITSADIFLYNSFSGGGKRGLACITLSVVDGHGNLLQSSRQALCKESKEKEEHSGGLSVEYFNEVINFKVVEASDLLDEDSVILQARIWEQGRTDLGDLVASLKELVSHALWELVTEYFLLPNDFKMSLTLPFKMEAGADREDERAPNALAEALNKEYRDFATEWLDVGMKLGVASVSKTSVEFLGHYASLTAKKELQHQIMLAVNDVKTKSFQMGSFRDPTTGELETAFFSCNRHGFIQQPLPEDKLNIHEAYIVVARNEKHWQACLNHSTAKAEDLAPKAMRVLQKFQPLVIRSSQQQSSSSSTDSTPAHHPPTTAATTSATAATDTSNSSSSVNSSQCDDSFLATAKSTSQASSSLESGLFIPRQRLIEAHIYKDRVMVLSYNCSRECVEKLKTQVSNLGHWFGARSALSKTIMAQKLGLFHNQAYYRKSGKRNANPFLGNMKHIESLVKHAAPPQNATAAASSSRGSVSSSSTTAASSSRSASVAPLSDQALAEDISHIHCNNRPPTLMQESAYSIEKDTTSRHGRQLLEMRSADKRDVLVKIERLWQSKGTSESPFSRDDLAHVKQISRLEHFVYTPLLFLPRWRYEAHSTRLRINCDEVTPERVQQLPSTKESSGGKRILRPSNIEIRNHHHLVDNYIREYVQYLYNIGFLPIQAASSSSSPGGGGSASPSRMTSSKGFFQRTASPTASGSDKQKAAGSRRTSLLANGNNSLALAASGGSSSGGHETRILQKTVAGGLLVVEVGLSEPFIYMKLYALESTRFLISTQAQAKLDYTKAMCGLSRECERVKKSLHMHSFTYDFHLRTIHLFVAGKPTMRQGYNLVHFLDDFMMYYSKAPNFSRNTMFYGTVDIPCTSVWVTPNQLYNYVLNNEKQYNFRVIRMEPLYVEKGNEQLDLTYSLVRNITYSLSKGFPGDLKKKVDDDVEIALVVHHETRTAVEPHILRLKYYIVFTCKKDKFPCATSNINSAGIYKPVTSGLQAYHMQPNMEVADAPAPVPAAAAAAAAKDDGKDIITERVDWVGYYSTHEQSMLSVMNFQAASTEAELASVMKQATVHCRRDQLWKGLHDDQINTAEFQELLGLVSTDPFSVDQTNLLAGRGIQWYRNLRKTLNRKSRGYRKYTIGSTRYIVVLSNLYVDMVTLLTLRRKKTSTAASPIPSPLTTPPRTAVLFDQMDPQRVETAFFVMNKIGPMNVTEENQNRKKNLAESFVTSICHHVYRRQ